MKKLVLFGAGKIGRSFIGQLFSRGGYEIVFVDVDRALITEMNHRRSYRVIIKSEAGDEVLNIANIRGIHISEREKIVDEIAGASLLATCVGPLNLPSIVPFISEAVRRKRSRGLDCRTDLIIAENLRNAAIMLCGMFIKELEDASFVDQNIGLVETSIGKMVPIMTRRDMEEDRLQVFAEPYNILILDEKAFRNEVPDIPGLAPKKNMKAWVDRKSFIHNLGHAAGAYYSYIRNPRLVYFYQAMDDPDCREFTRKTMLQSAEALIREYPEEFIMSDLTGHIDDLLKRFRNQALGDTVFRVGMDLYRKLGPDDRLVGAIRIASKHGLPFDKIAFSLACGFHFRGTDEAGRMFPADESFAGELNTSGPAALIKSHCGIDPSGEKNIFAAIMNALDVLKNPLNKNRP
ncbi:MAG TPA: hypothetical protein VI583_14455 [Cyclobacteriaceae bacterium]|nr:hypothetical protein [Cyclobacteriaceae bacterium]